MITANIHNAKTNLSKLLEKVTRGEDIVIKKFNKPIARIIPYQEKPLLKRSAGKLRGRIIIKNGFDNNSKKTTNMFCNSVIFPKK